MANFSPFKFTNVGLDLEYNAQAGKPLNFSKFVLGDGEYTGSIRDLTELVNPVREEEIARFEIVGTGSKKRIRIGFSLDTTQITEGFYLREIGLYAKDPDTNEDVLMFYTNAGETADYISNNTSTTVTTKLINAEVFIDDVAEITASIETSLVYALAKDTYNKTEVDEKIEDINIQFDADIEEINNELNYLNENKYDIPTKVASGENVYIEDAFGSPLVSLSGDGKSEQVTTSGSNMLNFNVAQNEKVTVNDDGTITINGTGGFALNFEELTLKAETTYYQKFELVSGTMSTVSNSLMSFDGSRWLITSNFLNYTPTEDTTKKTLWLNAGTTFTNAVLKIWANTDQSEYEPYTGGQPSPNPDYPQEIETIEEAEYKGVGKNICPVTLTGWNWNGLKVEKMEEGKYKINGTSDIAIDLQIASDVKISLVNGEYYKISIKVFSGTHSGDVIANCRLKTETNSTWAWLATNTAPTKQINEDNAYIDKVIIAVPKGQTFTNCIVGVQIERVENANASGTDFEPYQETTLPIDLQGNELCKVGITADKLLIDRKGNVAIEKNIGKVVLNGSEDWQRFSTTYGFDAFGMTKADIKTYKQRLLLCDYFVNDLNGITKDNAIANKYGNFYNLEISYTKCTTVTEFKAWLQQNNVTVYYQTTTPQIIELGTIENPEIFKGVNNIVVETNLGTMNIEVEYGITDLTKRFSEIYGDIKSVENSIEENSEAINDVSDNLNEVAQTVDEMEKNPVPNSRKIAGIDLVDDITKSEMLNGLGITNTGIVSQNIITGFWSGTKAEYEALGTYQPTILYLINNEE